MDKQGRPLDDYFEAARNEPGITEDSVRAIVRDRLHASSTPARRWIVGFVGVGGALAIALAVRDGGSAPRDGALATGAKAVSQVTKAARPGNVLSTIKAAPYDSTTTRTMTSDGPIHPGGSMNRKHIMHGVAAAAIALGAGSSASSQSSEPQKRKEVREEIRIETSHELSPIMGQMASELGRKAAEFWTERLNSYKARIDRTLSPDDLDKLNRMRVRFGVMLAEHASVDGDIASATATDDEVRIIKRHRSMDAVKSDNDTSHVRKIEVHVQGDGADALEFLGLHSEARALAQGYRSDMDVLGRDVMIDVATFVHTLKESADAFVTAHKVELSRTEDGANVELALTKGDDIAAELTDPENEAMIQLVYSMAIEPLIMLYDGADLAKFFGQAGPLSSAVTGLNLPEMNALSQNVPNPASGKTTITYKLEEPSSATTLRLYDATGELVGTYDQGAVEAGTHTATLDISKLANGVYLYHLTVKTATGERVYSRPMQVAR